MNVDLSELHLAAAKMKGLIGYLEQLRKLKVTYSNGLSKACNFVKENDGNIIELDDGETKLSMLGEEAICFQPYPDIDLFYWES
jgi:hypothetical protein